MTTAGSERFADVFAGVEVDTDQGVVIVWRKPSTAFDSYVAGQAWHSAVRARDAKHSAAELQVTLDRLRSDTDFWRADGISLELRAKHDGTCVEVGAAEPAKAEVRLTAHYRDLSLCFVPAQGRTPLVRSSPSGNR